MSATATDASATLSPTPVERATTVPGPPELLPGRPDAIVDLQTDAGVALVAVAGATATRACARSTSSTSPARHAGPARPRDRPEPHLRRRPARRGADFDDSDWPTLAPADTMRRLGNGRVCFDWYRLDVTIPDRVGDLDPTGATVVFEVVVDDYAEVWVDGALPLALGARGGPVVAGFNAPNRVVLTRDARPATRFTIAVFGINGPISASPANYIWMRHGDAGLLCARARGGGAPVAFASSSG
jgi:gluconolactonase